MTKIVTKTGRMSYCQAPYWRMTFKVRRGSGWRTKRGSPDMTAASIIDAYVDAIPGGANRQRLAASDWKRTGEIE